MTDARWLALFVGICPSGGVDIQYCPCPQCRADWEEYVSAAAVALGREEWHQ